MKTLFPEYVTSPIISRLQEPEKYEEFKRQFYRAFEKLPAQVLLREIWEWNDHEKTVSLRIRPENECVFAWYKEGEVMGYAAACLCNEPDFSQVRHYGFDFPGPDEKIVEVMTLFRCEGLRGGSLNYDFLEATCYPFLRANGYHSIVSTCAERVWPVYRRWGWHNSETREINGFQRYLILKKL